MFKKYIPAAKIDRENNKTTTTAAVCTINHNHNHSSNNFALSTLGRKKKLNAPLSELQYSVASTITVSPLVELLRHKTRVRIPSYTY